MDNAWLRERFRLVFLHGDEFPDELYVPVSVRGSRTDFNLAESRRYFIIGHLARNDAEIIRLAGLLRGTESAAQAVSVRIAHVLLLVTLQLKLILEI